MVKVPGRGQRPPILITLKTADPSVHSVSTRSRRGSMAPEAAVAPAFEGTPASVPAPVPVRLSGGGGEVGQRPRRHFDGLFGQAKVDVDAFAGHFD